jgi:hypothetical protein
LGISNQGRLTGALPVLNYALLKKLSPARAGLLIYFKREVYTFYAQ